MKSLLICGLRVKNKVDFVRDENKQKGVIFDKNKRTVNRENSTL